MFTDWIYIDILQLEGSESWKISRDPWCKSTKWKHSSVGLMHFLEHFVGFYLWTCALFNSNVWASPWLSVYSSLCQRPYYHLFALAGWCEITTVTLPFFFFTLQWFFLYSFALIANEKLVLFFDSKCISSRLPLVWYDIAARFQQKPRLYSRRLTSGQVRHADAGIVCCSLMPRIIILKELDWSVQQSNSTQQHVGSIIRCEQAGQQGRIWVYFCLYYHHRCSTGDYHHVERTL